MGLLDSNIVIKASKSFNLTGAATTSNSYLNGGNGVFDVSHYQTLCFSVKTITQGVKFRINGGVSTGFTTVLVHDRAGVLYQNITSVGTYYADVSHITRCGFLIETGVENGTLDIDVVLKSGSTNDLKPIQSLFSKTETLTAGSTFVPFALYNYEDLFRYFKFITVCANFVKIKEDIKISTRFGFQGAFAPPKVQEEVFNTNRIYSDWIPLITPNVTVNLDFAAAAEEGDTVYIEVFGIR